MSVPKTDILQIVLDSLSFGDRLAEFCQRMDRLDEELYPETSRAIKMIMVGLIELANASDVVTEDSMESLRLLHRGSRDGGLN